MGSKALKTYIVKLIPDGNLQKKGQPKSEKEFQKYLDENENVLQWEKYICMQGENKNDSTMG